MLNSKPVAEVRAVGFLREVVGFPWDLQYGLRRNSVRGTSLPQNSGLSTFAILLSPIRSGGLYSRFSIQSLGFEPRVVTVPNYNVHQCTTCWMQRTLNRLFQPEHPEGSESRGFWLLP